MNSKILNQIDWMNIDPYYVCIFNAYIFVMVKNTCLLVLATI